MTLKRWDDWAAETLERRSLAHPPEFVLHRAIAIAGRRPRRMPPGWLAVAAMVLVGALAAVLFTKSERPELPSREVESAVRSGEIAVVGPAGSLDEMPVRFTWEGVENAARYTVKLLAVDDAVLFEATVVDTRLDLPVEFAATLHAAVAYRWTVEALDENGAVLARSQATRFEVRP